MTVLNSSFHILVEICTVQLFPPLVGYQTNWNSTSNILHCVIEFHGLLCGDIFLQHFIPFLRTIWPVNRNQSINPVNARSLMVGESTAGLCCAADSELQSVPKNSRSPHPCWAAVVQTLIPHTAGLVRLSRPVPKEPIGICSSRGALQSSVILPLKCPHHNIKS